jgi:hypothetical protein
LSLKLSKNGRRQGSLEAETNARKRTPGAIAAKEKTHLTKARITGQKHHGTLGHFGLFNHTSGYGVNGTFLHLAANKRSYVLSPSRLGHNLYYFRFENWYRLVVPLRNDLFEIVFG